MFKETYHLVKAKIESKNIQDNWNKPFCLHYESPIKKTMDFSYRRATENIIKGLPKMGEIVELTPEEWGGYGTPHYNPWTDKIIMPPKKFVASEERYYHVLFHELMHMCAKRVGEDLSGYRCYVSACHEEVIAEMGALLLSSKCYIMDHVFEDSCNYINGFLKQSFYTFEYLFQESEKRALYLTCKN